MVSFAISGPGKMATQEMATEVTIGCVNWWHVNHIIECELRRTHDVGGRARELGT